jgi:hypothetical protein
MHMICTMPCLCALLLAACQPLADSAGSNSSVEETAPRAPTAASTPASQSVDLVPVAVEAAPVVAPTDTAGSLPADVRRFKERRDECDHFRGEEPSDPARTAELQAALERTCTGTDAALVALRRRHSGDAAVMVALADYESDVE